MPIVRHGQSRQAERNGTSALMAARTGNVVTTVANGVWLFTTCVLQVGFAAERLIQLVTIDQLCSHLSPRMRAGCSLAPNQGWHPGHGNRGKD
jgi:hypothetical protein